MNMHEEYYIKEEKIVGSEQTGASNITMTGEHFVAKSVPFSWNGRALCWSLCDSLSLSSNVS